MEFSNATAESGPCAWAPDGSLLASCDSNRLFVRDTSTLMLVHIFTNTVRHYCVWCSVHVYVCVMCICVYMCVYTCMHTYIDLRTNIDTRTHAHTQKHRHRHRHRHVDRHTQTHTHTHTHTHRHTHTHNSERVHVCVCYMCM